MKTLDKISKTLDIVNKALAAARGIACVVMYGSMAWCVYTALYGKKASTKIKEEESDA